MLVLKYPFIIFVISVPIYQLLMADINQHKPVLDSLNSNVADDEDQHHPDEDEEQTPTTKDDHQQDDDTKKTEDLRESIDSINRRYVDVTKTVHEFEDRLETLSAKLGDFENEVGALEDWALPLYETLKTSEISLFSLSDFDTKLKVSFKIHNLADGSIYTLRNEDHLRGYNMSM